MDIIRVGGRFRLRERLFSGSAHEIYLAWDILSNVPGDNIVLKFENMKSVHHTLQHEFLMYKKLNSGKVAGCIGIPRVHWFGIESGFQVMAIDRLGPTLEDLFVRCNYRFTTKTVILLAGQLIRRLQYIHSRNIIHRDLKPSNIVIGVNNQTDLLHLIDFGLSKEFRDPNTHKHVPYTNGLDFIGTTAFASMNSHLGVELGRRDDLESLAYILFYFLWGLLPWQDLRQGRAVLERKQQITTHKLFQDLPEAFRIFFEYCRSLSFEDKPDYDHIYGLFNDPLIQEGSQNDAAFDWDVASAMTQNSKHC